MPSGSVTSSAVASAASGMPSMRASPFQLPTAKSKYLKKPSSERLETIEATSAIRWRRLRGPSGGSGSGSGSQGQEPAWTRPQTQSIAVETSSRMQKAGLVQP